MAAPDFPASPTVGQTYTAPSGLIYTWDGKVWSTTGAPQSAYWTDTGTALTPTTASENVSVIGAAGKAQYVAGTRTVKARLQAATTLDVTYLASNAVLNAAENAFVQDDASKPSWLLTEYVGGDSFSVGRMPAGGTGVTNLIIVDNAGNLTAIGTDLTVTGGGATTKGRLSRIAALPGILTSFNTYYTGSTWAHDDATVSGAAFYWGGGSQLFEWDAYAPNAGSTPSGWMTFGTSGNLTISGSVGQKASGTTWSNPSDIRLKENVKDYTRGLADIVRLNPISYTLKASGTETCGFDAEKVREVFPECVGTTKMKLNPDDEEETDVLTFDMHSILVALVNAVKELASK